MIHQLLGGRRISSSRVGNDDLMIKEEKQDSANEGDQAKHQQNARAACLLTW
jgi:hypothetical protein